MSKHIPLKTVAAAAIGCLIAGCSGGSTGGADGAASTSKGAPSAPAAATPTASGRSAALPGNGLGGSNAPTAGPTSAGFITKVCTAITVSDAQATVKAKVTKIDFDSNNEDPHGVFQCNVDEADQALKVLVKPEDSAKVNYAADVAAENVAGTPFAGSGDVAVWTQALHNPPDFYAHKGNATCEVTPGDIRELSLTNDASIIDGGVATPIAAAYAGKLAAICTDVFDAIG